MTDYLALRTGLSVKNENASSGQIGIIAIWSADREGGIHQ